MGQRLDLQTLLESFGAAKVYFQAPPTVQMVYPCIRYQLDDIDIHHADNKPYKHAKRYQVMVIDEDPDSLIPDRISKLPTCEFDRFYTADNLNHFVFRLFF